MSDQGRKGQRSLSLGSLRRSIRAAGLWQRHNQLLMFLLLAVPVTAIGLVLVLRPGTLPSLSLYTPLVVLAGLFLRPLPALTLFAYMLAWAVPSLFDSGGRPLVMWLALAGTLFVMVFMLWVSRSRDRLGVTGISGESMLVDLRDRLRRGGELPPLPKGWYAESTVDSAYGNSFSGDFLLNALSTDGKMLEIVLVDVSGKGGPAGSRALLLSGAFGGLLGSMRPEEFLAAANSYLLRQQWDEGFATCVHIAVDLVTGDYSVGSAGHPPVAQYSAGSGRWTVVEGRSGPLLGVLDTADFPRNYGNLGVNDALLLYTDGVVEARHRGLEDGIDRMLGAADRIRSETFRGLTRAVCDAARSGDTDDRAAVLLSRI